MALQFLPALIGAGASLLGGAMQASAMDRAGQAQREADMARLEEEKRVREQLRQDTEAQRAVADQAFADYQAGLIDYATAQERAASAMESVQRTIAGSQLSDVAKQTAMAEFKPYAVRTGAGRSFFDAATGQAGYELAPELAGLQQGMFGAAGQFLQRGAVDPQERARQIVEEQQALLAPQRQAEDIALRQQQLQRGRIGLGVSPEALGAGMMGGAINPEQYAQDLARARVDAELAAGARESALGEQERLLGISSKLLGAGLSPEEQARAAIASGVDIGRLGSVAGATQAEIEASGMGDYYRSLLAAQEQAGAGMMALPEAQKVGDLEAYQRQQQYLSNLQGSNLPYTPMTTPRATVPGSAYAGAALGRGLFDYGSDIFKRNIDTLMKPSYSGTGMTASNADFLGKLF
jgi:hypothetical protein